MRDTATIMFFALLPIMLVLGHDIYLAYEKANEDVYGILGHLQFSDIGWLWSRYAPDSYESFIHSVSPDLLHKYIGPVLEQTALVMAGVLACLVAALVYVASFIASGSIGLRLMTAGKKSESSVLLQKKKPMKYKRK